MSQPFAPTAEQLQEIVTKNRAYWMSEPDGERADLRGADLREADLENCTMNWSSHDLISARLLQAAGDDAYKRLAAGYILISPDWCWKQLKKNVPAQIKDLLPWTFATMREWVKEGDNAPRMLTKKIAPKSQEIE